MKTKKIRGHKRLWKAIDQWKNENLPLDLETLKVRERDYTKIYVHPYSSISMLTSVFPQPKGVTRKRIIIGLFEIYEQWELQLKSLNEPYYLKIWLYEPRFSNSQVVCAIGNCLQFYDNTFYKPEISKRLNPNNFGSLKHNISNFNWEYRYDEEHMNNAELGNPEDYYLIEAYNQEKKWIEQRLKKPHRVTTYTEPIGDATEGYSFKKGVVWIGEKL